MKTFVLFNFIMCYAFKSHTFLGSIADAYLSKNYPEIALLDKIMNSVKPNAW